MSQTSKPHDPELNPRQPAAVLAEYNNAYSSWLNQHPGSKERIFWEGVMRGIKFCQDDKAVCPCVPAFTPD